MKKLSILFAAFAVVFLASCGKYEDGPGLSLRSKKARLTGTWVVESAIQGSTDITGDITNGGSVELTFEKGWCIYIRLQLCNFWSSGKWLNNWNMGFFR